VLALSFASSLAAQDVRPIPQVRIEGAARQLIVDNRPFLILG